MTYMRPKNIQHFCVHNLNKIELEDKQMEETCINFRLIQTCVVHTRRDQDLKLYQKCTKMFSTQT